MKLSEIVIACNKAYKETVISKGDLQSLLGKLLYISKIIKPARGFLNRMLEGLRNMGTDTHLHMGDDFKKDLLWFKTFSSTFNGTTTFTNWAGEHDTEVYVDASLRGLGAVWDECFFVFLFLCM